MIASALALLLATAPALGGEGWAVVAGAGDDKKAVEPLLQRYLVEGLPKHGDYPRLVEASELGLVGVQGWALVVGVPAEEDVAVELAAHLNARRFDARTVRATSAEPEDLRLLTLDRVGASGNGAPLFVFEVCLTGPVPTGCYGAARPDEEGRLMLAYIPGPAKEAMQLLADVGDPWVCGGIVLGLPREGLVWRRGPSTASCYEPAAPKPRRR